MRRRPTTCKASSGRMATHTEVAVVGTGGGQPNLVNPDQTCGSKLGEASTRAARQGRYASRAACCVPGPTSSTPERCRREAHQPDSLGSVRAGEEKEDIVEEDRRKEPQKGTETKQHDGGKHEAGAPRGPGRRPKGCRRTTRETNQSRVLKPLCATTRIATCIPSNKSNQHNYPTSCVTSGGIKNTNL